MKKLIIIVLVTLAFTLCDTDSIKDDKPDPIINPGDTPDNPITRIESRQLTTMAWVELLNEIEDEGKYVALDLSACTRGNQTSGGGLWSDGSFYPDPAIPSWEKGKNKIVSLVLPEAAICLPDVYLGTDSFGLPSYSRSFRYFSALKNVTGINITTIGRNTFQDLGTYTGYSVSGETSVIRSGILTNIDFPNVTKINQNAFISCYSLINANIPKVKVIEGGAFQWTKLQSLYIPDVTDISRQAFVDAPPTEITLGKIAPSVDCLSLIRSGRGDITIRVPQGATGYGDVPNIYIGGDKTKNWGNAFRGMGWVPSRANTTIPDPLIKYDAEGYGPIDFINTSLILRIVYIP